MPAIDQFRETQTYMAEMDDQVSAEHAAVKRSAVLRALGLWEPLPESEFDDLVELATTICKKPMGAMTLLDETSQLMKARVGFKGSPIMAARDSICQYTIRGTSLMMVEDVAGDARFAGNTVLEEDANIRFYAGMPFFNEEGIALGALCVMDTEPSTLSPEQQRALEILGRQVSNQIQMRERAMVLGRLDEERERGREMFNTILNNIPLEIYLKDKAGHLRFYNRKLAERFAISDTEWLGKTSRDLWSANTADSIQREDDYVMRTGKPHESFLELRESNGKTSYWKSTKVRCDSVDGESVLACCSVDVTEHMEREGKLQQIQDELEEANRKLNSLALTDALTGLWNRRAFDARLETNVIAAQRSKQPMALMLVDVDNFKFINDTHGHPYGDTILRHIGTLLNRVKRAEDVACRYGGEEFAILLPGSNIAGAQALGQRLLQAFHAFPWEKGPVTASLGLAMCTPNCSSDELVDDADSALYEAKHTGKDRMVCRGCEGQ